MLLILNDWNILDIRKHKMTSGGRIKAHKGETKLLLDSVVIRTYIYKCRSQLAENQITSLKAA